MIAQPIMAAAIAGWAVPGGRPRPYDASMNQARLLQVNVSDGGVPKQPVSSARISAAGVEGDRQASPSVHGGPHRAVSILGIEAIRRVAAEGHPIAPGTTGENLTIEGVDVSTLEPGTRLAIGTEVVLEIAKSASPCRTIRHSFNDLRIGRLSIQAHPTDSRMYARVVREGLVRPGDPIRLSGPEGDAAARYVLAQRLDAAERTSSLAVWRAAAAAGCAVHILDDGELAVAAAPELPGPVFNLALGFAHLPNLIEWAVDHFRGHRSTGWIWTATPPWPGAVPDSTAVYAGLEMSNLAEPTDGPGPDGLAIRELAHDETGAWAQVIVEAAGFSPRIADAWRALEPHLALAAHGHRFAAELGGRVVGAGALHTYHGVGWLRAGTVLPEFRGQGIQRALISARIDRARRLGCTLIGASADERSPSVRNLERLGFNIAAVRGRYRVKPGD